MAIHHDKLAYGKLASLREDFTEERLEKMAKMLSDSLEKEDDVAPRSDSMDKADITDKAGADIAAASDADIFIKTDRKGDFGSKYAEEASGNGSVRGASKIRKKEKPNRRKERK